MSNRLHGLRLIYDARECTYDLIDKYSCAPKATPYSIVCIHEDDLIDLILDRVGIFKEDIINRRPKSDKSND